MISLGPIGFAAPLALIALIALPLLWLLLRATPPAPRHVVFAPLRLLQRLAQTPQTPQSAPWWLIMLRLVMAAIVVIALAQPVWRPDDGARSDLPVLVVVDNGWQAAQGWPRTMAQARAYLESADTQGRRAALALTASQSEIVFENASGALARLDAVRPQSWSPDRADLAARLEEALSASGAPSRFDSWWLSDGVAGEGDATLARLISQRGRLVVSLPGGNDGALALRPVSAAADGFEAQIIRSGTGGTRDVTVSAVGQDGQVIARAPARFEDGRSTAQAEARLPLDLRNRLASVRLEVVERYQTMRGDR